MNNRSLPSLKIIFFAHLLVFYLFSSPTFAGSNYFEEEKIALSLKETEEAENIVWLKTPEKRDILALLSPSNISSLQGGVIILADLYQSPDWPVTVHGLRKHLPNYGWETLSIQLPVPTSNPSNPELDEAYTLTQQRIEAAVLYFKNKNINNISLIGISQSANFSIKYTASLPEKNDDIQSLVSIRAYDSNWLVSSDLVKSISLPMLDIYPEHDSEIILKSAKKRLISAGFSAKMQARPRKLELSPKVQKLAINKTGNLRYRQKVINGANYHFDKLEPTLIKVIRGWLGVYASGTKVTVN